jgi:hypothetical protein
MIDRLRRFWIRFPHVNPPRLVESDDIPIEAHRAGAWVMGVALSVCALGFGGMICFSQDADWSTHSLAQVMVFPDAPILFGVVLMGFGWLLLCGSLSGHPRLIYIGSIGEGFWFLLAGLTALVRAVSEWDAVSTAGSFAWITLATSCFTHGLARIDRSVPEPVEEPSSDKNL